jgi:hypothetical protein
MKKKLVALSILLMMCLTLNVGCNSSSSSSTDNTASVGDNANADADSNEIPHSKTGTVWDTNIDEVYELSLDKDVYPFSDQIYINVDENSKLIDYTIIVADETTPEQAVQYATDLIKALNDSASADDDSIAKSSDGYYGGMFDKYDVCMTIATEESVLNEKDWLVCQTVKAGEHTPMEAGGFTNE